MDNFEDFGIDKQVLDAVFSTGYANPTSVQKKVIPPAIQGRDIIACAPTGTGKTAAFLIPIIDFIVKNPQKYTAGKIRALILSPTSELAFQTRDFALKISDLLNIKITTIVGKSGISSQLQELRTGTDIVIATPGRAVDLANRDELLLDSAEICVIDETDRMTDMGFISDVSKLAEKLSFECQIMFFSATINKISAKIAGKASREPLVIDVRETINKANLEIPENIAVNAVYVEKDKKRKTLLFLLNELKGQKIIVFVDSKSTADAISKEISQKNFDCVCIHSDKTQTQRNYLTEKFAKGSVKILVATDIAARGLDFCDVNAVISLNIPSSATLFVHRTGRTGRMGKTGKTFCFCSLQERFKWYEIMKEANCISEIFPYHPFHSDKIENMGIDESREFAKNSTKRGEKSQNLENLESLGEKTIIKSDKKQKETKEKESTALAKKIAKRKAHKKYIEQKYGKKETGKGRYKGLANKKRKKKI
ncbi:MAG: DEAD/DEAH box helicase [Chitinivibrionia bacterium]|nr:DEAD/DEAH box helicase [Chitinivibrionia bacterium]